MRKKQMQIRCQDEPAFFKAIYECVTKGLTFTADAETLIIELTGGY